MPSFTCLPLELDVTCTNPVPSLRAEGIDHQSCGHGWEAEDTALPSSLPEGCARGLRCTLSIRQHLCRAKRTHVGFYSLCLFKKKCRATREKHFKCFEYLKQLVLYEIGRSKKGFSSFQVDVHCCCHVVALSKQDLWTETASSAPLR